uniref:Uncharacterized protein n=1 Tax=Anguilla anguilla TaxID=7936 RepID=A0A0E9TMK6_ANGAN
MYFFRRGAQRSLLGDVVELKELQEVQHGLFDVFSKALRVRLWAGQLTGDVEVLSGFLPG